MRLEMTVWKDYYEYWLTKKDIPVHLVRYEDILEEPYKYLKQVLEFMLEVDDITGSKVDRYL